MGHDRLRIVVTGLGRHAAKTVLPALAAAQDWDLAGVVSSRAGAAATTGDTHGVAGYTDLAEAIRTERPDAVYVATVPTDHLESCLVAASGGVDVIVCEKPIGVTGEQVHRILAEARRHSSVVCEVMAYQHHPQFRAVEDLIGGEEVGDLVHGYARFSYPHLPDDDHRYRSAAGGGALLDAGVYPLSMAARLLGTADLDVQAALYRGNREVDISGTATLTDGAGRSFQCSWGMGSAYTNLARIVGTAGAIEVGRPFSKPASFADPITVIGGWGDRTPVGYAASDQFVAMLADIARHRADPTWIETLHQSIEDRWLVIDRVLGG